MSKNGSQWLKVRMTGLRPLGRKGEGCVQVVYMKVVNTQFHEEIGQETRCCRVLRSAGRFWLLNSLDDPRNWLGRSKGRELHKGRRKCNKCYTRCLGNDNLITRYGCGYGNSYSSWHSHSTTHKLKLSPDPTLKHLPWSQKSVCSASV